MGNNRTTLKEGTRLGERYELQVHLDGHGAQGDIWKALDHALQRQVVIKAMKGAHDADSVAAARFVNEATCTAALTHPHIITVYDVGEETLGANTLLYYVMEHLPNARSLAIHVQARHGGRLSIEETLTYARQAASALACVHAAGFVHRDVKASNMLVFRDAQGQPTLKLIDLGLVRVADSNLTQTREFLGTPTHWPPEYAGHGGRGADARHDLFGLGVVLYHCLTGKRPFDGRNIAEVGDAIRTQDPEPVERLRAEVPTNFSAIVMQLLAKEPNDRFQSAELLLKALEQVEAPEPQSLPGISLEGFGLSLSAPASTGFDAAEGFDSNSSPNARFAAAVSAPKRRPSKLSVLPRRVQLALGSLGAAGAVMMLAMLLMPDTPATTPPKGTPHLDELKPVPVTAIDVLRDQSRSRVVRAMPDVSPRPREQNASTPPPEPERHAHRATLRVASAKTERPPAAAPPRRKKIEDVVQYHEPATAQQTLLAFPPGSSKAAQLETAIALRGSEKTPVVAQISAPDGTGVMRLLGDARLQGRRVHIRLHTLADDAGKAQKLNAVAAMPDGSVGLVVDLDEPETGYMAALGQGLIKTAANALNPFESEVSSRMGREAEAHVARERAEALEVYVPKGRQFLVRFGVQG